MAEASNLRKAGTEERILATAAGLFATRGYNGVSTRDIASGAGVNEVTIYRHHSSKRDLYLAVLEAELQQVKLRGDLLAHIAEADDGRAVLERTFELISNTLLQRPELLRLVQYSTLELGEDLDPLLRKHLGELVEVIARYLEPWTGNGEARPADTKAVVLALISFVVNYDSLHRLFLRGKTGPEAIFNAYSVFCAILMDKARPFCNTQVTPAEDNLRI
jgi:AcrR family transcriptional regulator